MSTKAKPQTEKAKIEKSDLTNGSVAKHLVRLTIPMIWGIAAVIIAQLTDTYFVGQLGTTELAAISFTFPVTMILSHLVFGLNIAMSSNVSRLIGQKDNNGAKRVTLHGVIMAFIVASIVAVLTYFALEPIFEMLGAGDDILPLIREYMPVWLIASVILSVPVNGNSALRASGDAFWPAVIMTFSAVLNMILDPIFIFGLLGVPAFGIKGAAIASVCAYIGCAILGLYILIVKKKLLDPTKLHLNKFYDSFKRLSVIALPAGITNIIGPLTQAVITGLLATHGAEAVAGFGINSRMESFALLAVISLGLAMAPIIGQNWGAEEFGRVKQTIKYSIQFNFLWSFAIAVLFGVFAKDISRLFTDDPAVIEVSALYFWIVPASFAFGNLIFGWSSAFNAMGKPIRAFVMIITKSVILTIPAIYIGDHLDGVKGIFIAIAIVNIISGLFFHIISWHHCNSCQNENTETKTV